MAFGTGVPIQAKLDLAVGNIHLDASSYKCALYVQSAAVNVNTAASAYSATGGSGNTSTVTGEIVATGYTAGGVAVTKTSSKGTAKGLIDFTDPTWSGFTNSTADAFIIYNVTQGNKILFIGTITASTVTAGTLTIVMPTADDTNALIRIN